MPKIKLDQPIKDYNGEIMKRPSQNGKGQQDVTIGWAIRNVLASGSEEDDGDDKLRKHKIGLKCVESEPNLNADEISTIKALVKENYNPVIVGRVVEVLDPDEFDEKVSD